MQKSNLDASLYGIGELITQRKLFSVPEHQRNFAWTEDELDQFVDDILSAIEKNAADYFIGLFVLIGPRDGYWQILDGQQRLTATTLLFSAVRHWLLANQFTDDATQIEKEFIGVRQLGGLYSARLKLNLENDECFRNNISNNSESNTIQQDRKRYAKGSSNFNLLGCALTARSRIERYAENIAGDIDQKSKALFRLSNYLETRVKVVCVDVASESDAFILFEALNDRGADLSVLDLLRNYVFSKVVGAENSDLRDAWYRITERISDREADYFLKIFWTSRFGTIQKQYLFEKIRETFEGTAGVRALVNQLDSASYFYEAIKDPGHDYWKSFKPIVHRRISDLIILGSKQVQPLLLAALAHYDSERFTSILWPLCTLLVRFQLIGQQRTGVLEKGMGRCCQRISDGKIASADELGTMFRELGPADSYFIERFESFNEWRDGRVSYLLSELDASSIGLDPVEGGPEYLAFRAQADLAISVPLYPASILTALGAQDQINRIANRVMVTVSEGSNVARDEAVQRVAISAETKFTLTNREQTTLVDPLAQIAARGKVLSELAGRLWSFD